MNRIPLHRFKNLTGTTASGANVREMAVRAYESAQLLNVPAKPNKYSAKKVTTAEGVFDSQMEYRRWEELKLLRAAGQITNLERQVLFKLEINGVKIGRFTLDHMWFDVAANCWRYEDVKGVIVRDFTLRVKLMKAIHGIDVTVWPERKRKARKRK